MNLKADTEYIFKTGNTISYDGTIPLKQMQEIVRCKDCKHWGEEEFAEGGYRECNCPQKDYATTDPKYHAYFQLWLENDFCSYGKRKGGDE